MGIVRIRGEDGSVAESGEKVEVVEQVRDPRGAVFTFEVMPAWLDGFANPRGLGMRAMSVTPVRCRAAETLFVCRG